MLEERVSLFDLIISNSEWLKKGYQEVGWSGSGRRGTLLGRFNIRK